MIIRGKLNVNLKSSVLEEVIARRKELHKSTVDNLIAETRRDLLECNLIADPRVELNELPQYQCDPVGRIIMEDGLFRMQSYYEQNGERLHQIFQALDSNRDGAISIMEYAPLSKIFLQFGVQLTFNDFD